MNANLTTGKREHRVHIEGLCPSDDRECGASVTLG
jgi:hypothetical protein